MSWTEIAVDSSFLSVTGAGQLIAALPAFLGFYPEDSVVLVSLSPLPDTSPNGVGIGVVLRCDLERCLDPAFTELGTAARVCSERNARQVVVVLIDSQSQPADVAGTAGRGEAYRQFLIRLDRALVQAGTEVAAAWVTTTVQAGAPWWSLLDIVRGIVPDPTASPLTLAIASASGRPIYRSRAHVDAALERDEVLAAQVRTHLLDAADRPARAGGGNNSHTAIRASVELVLSCVDAAEPLTPARLAEVAVAVGISGVPGCLMGLSRTIAAASAHRLWTELTRALPDPQRAEAAVLLAFSAYLTGDGALAVSAIGVALRLNPDHQIARMLETAFSIGLPPEQLQSLALHGISAATDLGIAFPASTRK